MLKLVHTHHHHNNNNLKKKLGGAIAPPPPSPKLATSLLIRSLPTTLQVKIYYYSTLTLTLSTLSTSPSTCTSNFPSTIKQTLKLRF